jgi:hypothetical protein
MKRTITIVSRNLWLRIAIFCLCIAWGACGDNGAPEEGSPAGSGFYRLTSIDTLIGSYSLAQRQYEFHCFDPTGSACGPGTATYEDLPDVPDVGFFFDHSATGHDPNCCFFVGEDRNETSIFGFSGFTTRTVNAGDGTVLARGEYFAQDLQGNPVDSGTFEFLETGIANPTSSDCGD